MKNYLKERVERYFDALSKQTVDDTCKKLKETMAFDLHKFQMEHFNMVCDEKGLSEDKYFPQMQVVISLTTYGQRLQEVYLTIESIMQQTVKPNHIILWLQDDLQGKPLPVTLQRQVKRGLEIGYCKDIKSYKKLIPSLRKYPDDIIVTIDDDILFSLDMLENLLVSYKSAPQYIHTNRAHIMKLLNDDTLDKYINWELDTAITGFSPLLFPTGGAGTLYPPHSFSEEVFNEEAFMTLSPKGDDIWFKAMSLLGGKQCYRANTHKPYMFFNPNVQEMGLWNDNIYENDIQLKKVFSTYKLYNKLKNTCYE